MKKQKYILFSIVKVSTLNCKITYFGIPEDPVNSTPDVSHFFFSGQPVRGTMCNMFFFFENFGVHFDTFKTGTQTPEVVFLIFFPVFSGEIVPGLYAKILFKKTILSIVCELGFIFRIINSLLYWLFTNCTHKIN